ARLRYEPRQGLARADGSGSRTNARERHGLFRCGAFGAACVVVHRSNIREWLPPGPNSRPTSDRLFGSGFCELDPHCLTVCDPLATYRRLSHSAASAICRCITDVTPDRFQRLLATINARVVCTLNISSVVVEF